jgi:hypothetical protein
MRLPKDGGDGARACLLDEVCTKIHVRKGKPCEGEPRTPLQVRFVWAFRQLTGDESAEAADGLHVDLEKRRVAPTDPFAARGRRQT